MNITYDAAVRPDEVEYVKMVEEVTHLLNKRFDFKITDLRIARKPKAFGSTGTADFHRYTYRSQPGKVEIWVNLAHGMLSSEQLAMAIASTCIWSARYAEYNHKECTAEMVAARDPEGKYKHDKNFKKRTLHKLYMKSEEILAKLHGPVSAKRLIEMVNA